MFDNVCDCGNLAQCWIRGGRLSGGCEPMQEPLWSNTQRDQGDAELRDGQLSLSASQLLVYMLFRLRDQDLVAPHGMKILLSVCRLRRAGHAFHKALISSRGLSPN